MEDTLPLRGFRFVRARALDWVAEVGRVTLLLRDIARFMVPGLRSVGLLVQQMGTIGVGSLWLVVVVSLFTGAVAAVQAAYQFTAVVPMRYLGSVVLRSVIIELGPVLTGLVVGGRVGASIAAELGTMKVTEQIDALRALAIHPVRYLVVPRVVASIIMLPIMTIFSDAIAVFGGWVVAVTSIGISSHTYTQSIKDFFLIKDLLSGLVKAFFFGGIIGTMGCYYGFATEGGAEGVGAATTKAVMTSCVLVLISDYVLANVLFRFIFAK
ncbi:MAG TPA: ABC transporter permease [Candidatus Eisenbacteria bacterium]|nr:ABC transporter permease [Candidatus Eisenbacteria bacterium]